MNHSTRTRQQVACDGVQTIWLPHTPALRTEVEKTIAKSMDGVVFAGSVRDVAMHMHRNDLLRAAGGKRNITRVQDTITDFIATMDGIRVRRVAVANA